MAKAFEIVNGRVMDAYGRDLGPATQQQLNPTMTGVDPRAFNQLSLPSMLGGSQPESPSMDIGTFNTGSNLATDQANINYATNVAQTPYLPGSQQVMVDGSVVANPDFGRAAPDLGPNIAEQFAASDVGQKAANNTFLQDTSSKGISQSSGPSSGSMIAAGQQIAGFAESMGSDSVGAQTTSGVISGMTTGATIGSIGGPVGAVAGAAIGAVLGGIMGSRKAKKAERAREKAEKKRRELEKRARTERVYTAKMAQDSAAYNNLRQAVSSALRRDNQIQIRT